MTLERMAAAALVVEAARAHKAAWENGNAQFARERLYAAVAALDALPAEPQTVGETVEVAVWVSKHGGMAFAVPGSDEDVVPITGSWRRLGTTRLPIITTVAPGGGEGDAVSAAASAICSARVLQRKSDSSLTVPHAFTLDAP
jgi:hypothetical protein